MKNKKGQESGSSIAVLILLMALFILLYVLLLPPEQRETILNQSIDGTSSEQITPSVLLSESPGQIYPEKEGSIIHDISPINIFLKTEPTTKKLASSLEISKGLFSNNPQRLTFNIDSLTNLKSVTLFFSVIQAKGNLKIWINDNILLDKKVSGVQTIDLPVSYLKKINTLIIEVSHPGILFFTNNVYELETIGIKENYELLNPKEERTFSMPEYEKNSLQKAVLSYQIYCNKLDKGSTEFNILLNNKRVLSKIITCIGGTEEIELPIENIREGTNILIYTIDDGDFQISNIKIETELKEKSYPTYHFDISNENYNNLINGEQGIIINLKFLTSENKKAAIQINGKQFLMDTKETEYSKDIKDYINEGDNFIKIIPSSTFTIDLLEIKLV